MLKGTKIVQILLKYYNFNYRGSRPPIPEIYPIDLSLFTFQDNLSHVNFNVNDEINVLKIGAWCKYAITQIMICNIL